MTKKEIYELEQTNYNKVFCYKEGAFWVAYEHSAYLFCKCIRPFSASKKPIQTVGNYMVSIGFPDQAWAQLSPMVVFAERDEKRIVLDVKPKEFTYEEFEYNFTMWKDDVQTALSQKQRSLRHHENLPVYKAVFDLTIKIFQQSQHMSREFRYTLGERLKNEAINLLIDVYSASTAEDKLPHILSTQRRIELIRVMLRVCREMGQLPIKNMASMTLHTDEITKQLAAWLAATMKRQPEKV